ncbi:MAG: hypothetical protein AB1941_24235 [Gemmatimonadota bacterium]
MNEVYTDGGAENFDDSSLIPPEWWLPQIEQNSPRVGWSGNTADGYTWVKAWSNRGLVTGSILVTNSTQTVAQQSHPLGEHSSLLPQTWLLGLPYDLPTHMSCGQTADFKSTVAVSNVVLVKWELMTLGSKTGTTSASASQDECLPYPGGGGGSTGSGFDKSTCWLWGTLVNGVLVRTYIVC